ncbi:ExbD/TolR family protein [Halothermothrix orenii]|uniref:Biopolymer transport protein ExbD/TolR n=1 Tax=Halothermothrix orenii (strain H 168 / OCM 544 / DSM 9562) TaxID=373903 RepID=B8CXB1_HALOH|nr:biopolymer transporter ExbD [Halothermothrix orenii]ACL69930.1 Biopolymer transport protein ExbD/TolR [Halothermothrix orenii H 168]
MLKTSLKKKPSINIIPMIDVIFFLLVFFMLFTTFRTTPYGIDLQLPKAVTVTGQQENNMIVNINEKGELYYRGDKVTMSRLKNIAKKRTNQTDNLVVIINADKDTKYRYIVQVMDNLRQVGIYKLALAAEKEG